MKIAVICDTLGAPNNGTTIAALNLIGYLKSVGHEVRVVSPDETTKGKRGYYVVPRANLGRLINKAVAKNGVSLSKPDKSIIEAAIDGADVVHLLFPFPLAWAAAKLAHEKGIPVTASFHCQAENFTAHIGMMNSKLVNHLVYKVFYNKVYRYCARIHYPTEFIRRVFYENTGCSAPAEVISNGVNESFFNNAEKKRSSQKFTVICSGRYSREKAQHVLLKALAKSRHRDEIKLVLAGCGPKEQKLKKLVQKYGLDCDMRFFERGELGAYLRGADLYVHTAIAEIEAIACMEAIVSGLVPVICNSKRSATRFFALDGKCLYKKGSAKELSQRIDYFFENRGELERYRGLYEKEVKCFDQRNCMRRMEKMLKTAAAGRSVFAGAANPYPAADASDRYEDEPISAAVG